MSDTNEYRIEAYQAWMPETYCCDRVKEMDRRCVWRRIMTKIIEPRQQQDIHEPRSSGEELSHWWWRSCTHSGIFHWDMVMIPHETMKNLCSLGLSLPTTLDCIAISGQEEAFCLHTAEQKLWEHNIWSMGYQKKVNNKCCGKSRSKVGLTVDQWFNHVVGSQNTSSRGNCGIRLEMDTL